MNRIKLVLVMVLWGSLGVFTRSIPLSALSLAFLRTLIALPVLFAALKMKNTEKVEWRLLKPYIISGSILGFGWLTLFYGYKHTSISSTVILYNMCPVYVMIAAPLLLKEAISKIQIAVVFFSFLGLVLIVGQNLSEGYGYLGMALSAVSGMLYATIILINRSIKSRVDNQTDFRTNICGDDRFTAICSGRRGYINDPGPRCCGGHLYHSVRRIAYRYRLYHILPDHSDEIC